MRKSILLSIATAAIFSTAVKADTLDDVKKAGELKCGVSTGLAGFSQKDEKGSWSGLDVDVCRGIAAAVLASNSSLTATDVEQILRSTADKIGRRGGSAYLSDGAGGARSDFYGYGRVNTFAALQSALVLTDLAPAQNCTPDMFGYSPASDLLLPSFTPQSTEFCPAVNFSLESGDEICFPIPAQNGRFAVVCL